MRSSFLSAFVATLTLACAQPAAAALIVSGDSSLLTQADTNPANEAFLLNLAGSGIVALHPGEFSNIATADISFVLGNAAVPHFALGFDAAVTAADLTGASLYLSYGDVGGWTAAEALVLTDFVRNGGIVLLGGENSFFASQNAAINALAAAMGSSLAIQDDALDSGDGAIATILADNAFTAGTAGLRYISSSRVVGGTALFGAADGVTPIVGFDTLAAVPEPSTWVAMLIGFGMTGAALRSARRTGAPTALA